MSATTDWISSIADALSALGVIGGFWFANRQLSNWRQEGIGRKQSEVAEQAIVAAQEASEALRYMRAVFRRLPGITFSMTEDERNRVSIQDHERRVSEVFKSFNSLAAARVRVDALIGDLEASTAIEGLFDVRHIAVSALQETYNLDPTHPADRELVPQCRKLAFGSYDENDELGKRQLKYLQTIKDRLGPVARMGIDNGRCHLSKLAT